MIDLLIVLGFVAYAIYSGFQSKNEASKNLKEYFLAGKTLKGWKAGISMAATQFAADTPLLVTGLIATGGIFLLWRLWVYGIAFLLMGFLFSTKWRRSEVITDAELVDIRYSGKGLHTLRFLKAIYYGTIINCTVMAMVLVAAMRISEVFLLWDQWLPTGIFEVFYSIVESLNLKVGSLTLGADPYIQTTNNLISIFTILSFTTLYSTTGGLRSVVATDVMQFAFAMVGTLFYGVYVIYKGGGFSTIVQKIEIMYGHTMAQNILSFSPQLGEALMPFLILISIQWLFQMNSDGTGYLAQRLIACKSDKDARIAAMVFTWAQVLLRSLIWLMIGVGLLVLYPFDPNLISSTELAAARELTFVTGINEHLPVGIKGIMLTGLLGALASTIDTHLNWGSSYWSNDIYGDLYCRQFKKTEPNPKSLVWVARFSNLLILLIALTIMFNLGSIQQAWGISLLFGAGMGSVLILRWLWEKVNLYSELSAMVISVIAAPFILNYISEEWLQIVIMATLSTFVVILSALFAPKTDNDKLKSFYKKVKPQGLWGQTASQAGDDSKLPLKKLMVSLKQTFVTSSSLFLLLVGIGKLMFRPSGEGITMCLILITAGTALIPFWIKYIKES